MEKRGLFLTAGTGEEQKSLRDERVLRAAFTAWNGCAGVRRSRDRNKRFTYGDQWSDVTIDSAGRKITEWERYSQDGDAPITNNLIRQLVKTIVGRFRSMNRDVSKMSDEVASVHERNFIDELDARSLEEFLISGCCVQRVDDSSEGVNVENVNMSRFFVNSLHDPMSRDCEIVGQLHDMSLSELLRRVSGGSRRKAEWVKRLYSDNALLRIDECIERVGGDAAVSGDFWHSVSNKCRAIEVWTLESREVMRRRNRRTGEEIVEAESSYRRHKNKNDEEVKWDIVNVWHCRWYSPMGDLLAEWDSPYGHGSHPFVVKFYPLTDGEVHSVVEDVIDQQKYVNRLITLVDHILASCAKGVLLFPEHAMPEGFTWSDIRNIWRRSNGIIPYYCEPGMDKPQQISVNNTDIGAFEMIQLQLKMLEDVSGVSGALRGKGLTVNSSSLYREEVENASQALADVFETFNTFRRVRDSKISGTVLNRAE